MPLEQFGSGLGVLEDEAFLHAMAGLDAKVIALALAFPKIQHATALETLRETILRLTMAAMREWPEEAI